VEEGDGIAMYAGRGNAEAHCAGIDNNKFFLELPFLAQHIHFRKEGREGGHVHALKKFTDPVIR